MAPSDAPAALQPILEVAEDQAATDSEASDDNAGQDTVDTELPSMDDASAENARPEVDDAGVPTSPTTSQATSAAAPSSTAPTEAPEPEASEATTETATPEATKPPVTTEVPRAATVDVGRWFSLTGPGGVELGAAKVENIVRTPGCGVELTLSITTSAEAGPDRWASIGPDDFAEVRAGGTTRDAARISSDCVQSSSSRTTALSPGRDYQIVISFLIDDSAQQAMLRPGNTAGWFFDLPPVTRVSATSSPSAASPATSPAAASPSATSPSATSPSAARAETTADPTTETAAA